ncbi:MAG: class II aldolase/adducin family protein [Actinobacteria bacterium]|nr:class II aldolase/adducin family protein [Actinomycetota bacterium]
MSKVKEELQKYVKALYQKEILDSAGGNCSAREGDKVFVTRRESSSLKQWNLDEDFIIETDLTGKAARPEMQAFLTRESHVHYRILDEFPHINAVFHVHPRYLLGFASLKSDMPIVTGLARDWLFPRYIKCIKDEPEVSIRESVAVTKYFKYLYNLNPNSGLACLLPGHGAVIAGKDLREAFSKTEALENNARTFYYMQIIKNSNFYKEYKDMCLEDMYEDWQHIQRTQIKDTEFYFERKDVQF